jgi:uncharacterized protein (TIGR02452 family)
LPTEEWVKMKRSTRVVCARETVEVVERGSYTSPGGSVVSIAGPVRACLEGTRYFSPEDVEQLRREVLSRPSPGFDTIFEAVNETTLAGIARVLALGEGPVAALNFASARNPGGGFLGGAEAQEESLARSSALHASQLRAWEFYERHRSAASLLYSDAMILSPGCPIIRDDDGILLEVPLLASFITSPAPNAGATAANRPQESPRIPEVLRGRSGLVLAIAASHGYENLILGAWGCGVFRNDPALVAAAFMGHLRSVEWAGCFRRVVFSVLDRSLSQNTLLTFHRALRQGAESA